MDPLQLPSEACTIHSLQERLDDYSECGQYRYTLWRDDSGLLADDRYVLFIGARASEADDKTLQACSELAECWGYKSACLVNLNAALRGADPEDLAGPLNEEIIECAAAGAALVVGVWAEEGARGGRDTGVRKLLAGKTLHYAATTLDGHPCMPRAGYLPLKPTVYGQWTSEGERQAFQAEASD